MTMPTLKKEESSKCTCMPTLFLRTDGGGPTVYRKRNSADDREVVRDR